MSKKFLIGTSVLPRAKKEYRSRPAAIWLGFVAIFLVPAGLSVTAQRAPQQSASTTSAVRNTALVAATSEVLKETSEIRQLSILRPVQSSTQSRAEIERALIKNLDEDMSAAQTHASEVTLRKLGLVPANFQYRALMIRLLTEQVAGYYDPKTQWFHLADWIDLDGQRPIMAHELTHALQDQHFNLRRFEHWPKGDSDAELAAHALIEGDATLAMALYVASKPLRALAFLRSLGATGLPSEQLEKAPRALRETLLFPYQDGEKWVSVLYKQGGWDRVSKAFTDLPQSTEQIMHPEKYFVHEAPVRVTLQNITQLLNRETQSSEIGSQASVVGSQSSVVSDPIARSLFVFASLLRPIPNALNPASWRRLDSDVNGEWGFYLILDQFLKSPVESRRAAAGWGGDRFAVYENSKGEVLLTSLSTWDTESDAREFFEAYVKRTELRYPDLKELDVRSEPQTVSKSFHTSEGTVVMERRGERVLVLEGLPPSVDPKMLKRILWQ